jgi:hypothetical protein
LTLWDRLGVPRRPTWAALASSLTAIPQHSSLADDLLPRVKRLLRRFPAEVWSEVGCWVSLGKTWEPVDAFNYRRSASGISHGGDLFQQLLLQIADVRMLPSDRIEAPPFGHLPEIGGAIELRLSDLASTRDPRSLPRWLEILGFGLRRVRLKEDVKTEQVRQLAADLTSTKWLECDRIDVTPYCAGMPAGPAFRRDALWEKTRFLIRTARSAKMQRAVAEELARHFRSNEVREAVLACFEREPGFVRDYLEDTFELEAEAITQLGPVPDVPHATENEPSESRNAGTAVASGAVMKWNTENTAAEREDVAIPAGETLDSAGSPAPEAIGTDSVDGMEEATLTPVASEGTTALGAELPIDAIEQSEQPQEQPRSSVSEERAPKPTIQEPKLIDLFAELRGWSWNAERKRFESGDGVWAQKGDMPSVWDVFSPTGEVNQLVWVAPHFRESESVEVPAEVWSGILNTPTTWLVLSKKGDGQLRMYPGDLLRRMQDAGTLQVFPASYRIRLQ